MYILEFDQAGSETQLAVFETLEEGRAFVSKLPGYERAEEDGFIYESISAEALSDYMEVSFHDHRVPFSRWMFAEAGKVDIFWREVPNLSVPGQGMVSGATRIDAYVIANEEVAAYVAKREACYRLVKAHLEAKGWDVTRSFHGSEDGEAILYKKPDSDDWHFLSHLDPAFCEQELILEEVDRILLEEI